MSDGRTDDERPRPELRHKQKGSKSRATLEEIYADGELLKAARSLQCFTVTRVSRLLDCSSAWVKGLISEGKLKAFYMGQTIRVPAWAIWEFQDQRVEGFRVERIANSDRVKRWMKIGPTHRISSAVPESIKTPPMNSSTENPSNNPPKNN